MGIPNVLQRQIHGPLGVSKGTLYWHFPDGLNRMILTCCEKELADILSRGEDAGKIENVLDYLYRERRFRVVLGMLQTAYGGMWEHELCTRMRRSAVDFLKKFWLLLNVRYSERNAKIIFHSLFGPEAMVALGQRLPWKE